MSTKYAIEAVNVCKRYGENRALNNFNLQIEQGSFFAILGANGAGKSTFINILASCIEADSGNINVLGEPCQRAKLKIGIVPQDVNLDPFFSTQEYLEFFSGFYGIKNNQAHIKHLMEVLELAPHKNKSSRMLSGGMKRRLLIAKAMVHNPDVIVLDEPTAGVDIELKKRLWDYMKTLNKQGKTIVLTTHYLEEAEQLCDKIAIVKKGELIKSDTKQNLKNLFGKKNLFLQFNKPLNELLFNEVNFTAHENNLVCCEITNENCNPFYIAKLCEAIEQKGYKLLDFYIQDVKLEDIYREITK